MLFINHERTPKRGKSAPWTIRTLAYLAAHANRGCGCRIVTIQSSRIDKLVRVSDVASQSHGEGLAQRSIASASAGEGVGNAKVGAFVGHSGKLPQDAARARERFVDIPLRAGSENRSPTDVWRCFRRDRHVSRRTGRHARKVVARCSASGRRSRSRRQIPVEAIRCHSATSWRRPEISHRA